MAKLRPPSPEFLDELRARTTPVTGSDAERLMAANVERRMAAGEYFPTADEIGRRRCTPLTHQWTTRPGNEECGPWDHCSNCGAGRFDEAQVYAVEQYAEKLRLRYEECAQCHCSLQAPSDPPHCVDCGVDDAHRDEWDEAVGN